MSELQQMVNIGPTLAERLAEIGVFTAADLHTKGSAQAYTQIQANYPDNKLPLCYYLYSLEGALQGCDWRTLSAQQKVELQRQAGL